MRPVTSLSEILNHLRGMIVYHNRSGDSGVVAYEWGSDWIRVQFTGGHVYEYTHESAGRKNVATMKRLAESGSGLSTFISTAVKSQYSERVK